MCVCVLMNKVILLLIVILMCVMCDNDVILIY